MPDLRPPDDELLQLLAAHALDALDTDDRARVEQQVAASETARHELDHLRETAAMLALVPAPSETAPRELWDRIAQHIAHEEHEPTAPVVDLASRRGVPWKLAAPLAAAAVIVIALLSFQVIDLRQQVDDGARVTREQYASAVTVPGAREVTLAADGTPMARAVVLRDGTGYLRNDGMAPLDPDRTYQLWAIVDSGDEPKVISAGVLGPRPEVAPFRVTGPVVGFAITDEVAGGVPQSEEDPVATGMLPA
jgi:hypothetical protein